MTPDLPTTLTLIAREGRRLIDTCEGAPAAPVPACPGWSNTDLALHTAGVHRRVAHWVTQRVAGPTGAADQGPTDPAQPWGYCRESLDRVVEALRGIGPDDAVWSWTDRKNGGFYHRRILHETVVHRWDAESATGTAGHIDRDVAVDGIDELLDVGMRFRGNGAPIDYPDGSVLLEQTDGAARWRLRAMDGTLLVARGRDAGDQADAVVQGPADELLLFLWGRAAPTLPLGGEADVATAWTRVAP